MKAPTAIIIPTLRYDLDKLNACIESVEATVPDSIPIFLADDPNASFAENCNMGVEGILLADYEPSTYLFLNDDTIVSDGWLDPLLAASESHAVVGAQLNYPTNIIQHAGVYLDYTEGILTAHNHTTWMPSSAVEAVTGACMLIDANLFADLEGFDTAYVNGYEDVDFCLRARENHAGVYYESESIVIHHESASGPRRWSHVTENIIRLHNTYGESYVDLDGLRPPGWDTYRGPVQLAS